MANKQNQQNEYIAALQNFSKSLEYLVEAMSKQAQTNSSKKGFFGKNKKPIEDVKDMADGIKAVEQIAKNTEESKNNTVKILEIVQGIKKEKKTGIWDKLSGAKDKTKSMAEGIKSIALMAGGILAIGMAFKVIGHVNFNSVLALSIALPLIALAFNEVGKNAKSPKESALIASSMVMMSAGIVGAGLLLKFMPELNFSQLFSAVGVAVAIGAVMFGLSYAAKKLKSKDILAIMELSLVIPVVAAGIVGAGYVLNLMPDVKFKQAISAGMVGIAIGLAVLPLAYAAKISGSYLNELIEFAVIMPAIAIGIVASSYILQNVKEVPFFPVLEVAAAVGLATIVIAGTQWLLKKMNISFNDIVKGSLSIVTVSAGIMAASHLLSKGNYTNSPDLMWTLNSGISIAAFSLIAGLSGPFVAQIEEGIFAIIGIAGAIATSSYVLSLGTYNNFPSLDWAIGTSLSLGAFGLGAILLGSAVMTGIGGLALGAGLLAITGIATGIVATSAILNNGDYTKYPSLDWATGVGLSLIAFGGGAMTLGSLILGTFGLGGLALAKGLESIKSVAQAIVDTAKIFSSGNFSGGPTEAWAAGVGNSIAVFANAVSKFGSDLFGDSMDAKIAAINKIASAIVGVSFLLGMGKYSGGPTEAWSKNIGNSISIFAEATNKLKSDWFGSSMDYKIYTISKMGGAIRKIADDMNGIQIDKLPDLSSMYSGMVTLSLIDSDRMEDTLEMLSENEENYSKVMSMIQAQSDLKLNDTTFAFNKPKDTSNTTKTTSASSNINSSSNTGTNSNSIAKVQSTSSTETMNVNANLEDLIKQLINVIQGQGGVLGEIADNTAKTIDDMGSIDN